MELLITIIVLALIFDYINGFHDAANAIATIVSTKVLTPLQAVIWAAFFNFLAFFIAKYLIGDFGIANTVSKTVYEQYITLPVILSGVIAAIIWNLWTWWRGIPSSSSHTLIGGFAGAAIAAYGFGAIQSSVILKIVLFIFLAPVIGMLVAFLFTLIVLNLCRKAHPHTAEKWFKRLQLLSSALFSIGHGLNDSQKVMGIIAAALIAAHSQGIGMGGKQRRRFTRLGRFFLLYRNLTGNHVGRMENSAHHGKPDYQSYSAGRCRSRNSRCIYALFYGISENSGQHHPHHIRSHHRSGRHPSPVRSALGSYPKPDDSLGAYHPGKCGIGSSHLCTDRVTNLFFQGITNKEEKIAQTSDSSKKRTFIEIILLTFITFAHIVSNIVQFENGNTRQFYTTC